MVRTAGTIPVIPRLNDPISMRVLTMALYAEVSTQEVLPCVVEGALHYMSASTKIRGTKPAR